MCLLVCFQRFFGMIRGACGNADHPDPLVFLQVYRLMSTYSLVRPPPGSNVSGEELFNALLSVEEVSNSATERWSVLKHKITANMELPSEDGTDFRHRTADSDILEYVAGRIAKSVGEFKKCPDCAASATSTRESEGLIKIKNYFNKLHNPSDSLLCLIEMVEQLIKDRITDIHSLEPDSFFTIAQALEDLDLPIPEVGCTDHKEEVTPYIIRHYLTMRLLFITEEVTTQITNKSTELRKMGKLIHWLVYLQSY